MLCLLGVDGTVAQNNKMQLRNVGFGGKTVTPLCLEAEMLFWRPLTCSHPTESFSEVSVLCPSCQFICITFLFPLWKPQCLFGILISITGQLGLEGPLETIPT